MLANKGDLLPVSAFPVDGTWPTGTAQWEKRNIALEIPVWDPKICIQCNKCAMVCPHAAIRAKVYESDLLKDAPGDLQVDGLQGQRVQGHEVHHPGGARGLHRLRLCVEVCPAKDKANPKHKAIDMAPQRPLREAGARNYDFFLDLPEVDRSEGEARRQGHAVLPAAVRVLGRLRGCGETPYVKLLTQLFGDRALIANATGCSSIYGGNLPTTPVREEPRRPRPGLVQLAVRGQRRVRPRLPAGGRQEHRSRRASCSQRLAPQIGETLVDEILKADQTTEAGIAAQRERVVALRQKLAGIDDVRGALAREARRLPGARRASGSSAATAGPTTSATAASTT